MTLSPSAPHKGQPDPLADAAAGIAALIAINKPIYPIYIWYFIGNGVAASLWTLLAFPFYAAIPLMARRSPLAAKIAFPVVGMVDTLFATKLFGVASGAELFAVPCALLATLPFRQADAGLARSLVAGLYLGFLALHWQLGAPLHDWSAEDLGRIFNINLFAAVSLTALIGWRFAALPRG